MPNDKVFYAIAALAGVFILVAGGYLAGIQTGDAKAVARLNGIVVELQEENAKLSAAKTKKENEIAEQVSRANRAEQERINAIKTNSHQSARIKSLQRELDRISNAETGSDSRIIILDADSVERLREGVRRGGQPNKDSTEPVRQGASSHSRNSGDYREISSYSGWRRYTQDYKARLICIPAMQEPPQFFTASLQKNY